MGDLAYHSVHQPRVSVAARARWTGDGGSVAFVHDVMAGSLPAEYDTCDVLYTDLPWRTGFDRYNARAGVDDGRTYEAFMAAVFTLVRAQNRPVVLVTGKHAVPLLPRASQKLPVRMPVANRQPALAYVYGAALRPDWDGTDQLLDRLAAMYQRVGDFCAGYGWSARAFARAGKTFVASDYNPECIGYIAAHAAEWVPG